MPLIARALFALGRARARGVLVIEADGLFIEADGLFIEATASAVVCLRGKDRGEA